MISLNHIKIELQHIKNRIKTQGILFYLKRQVLKVKFKLEKRVVNKIRYKNEEIKIILEEKNGLVDLVIYSFGIFGKEFIELIEKKLDKDKVFVDVGANIGQHSLILSRYCKKVISFEPLPALYNQFKESVELNGFQNIEIHNVGCSDVKEEKEITIDPINAGGSTVLAHNNLLTNNKKETIKLDRLDDLIPNQQVDVIKIDVEGYEYFVLLGAEKIINTYKPTIFLEYSPDFYDKIDVKMSKKLYDLIKSYGYNIFAIQFNKNIFFFEDLPHTQIDLLLIHKDQ